MSKQKFERKKPHSKYRNNRSRRSWQNNFNSCDYQRFWKSRVRRSFSPTIRSTKRLKNESAASRSISLTSNTRPINAITLMSTARATPTTSRT